MHSRSHREPKKSIWNEVSPVSMKSLQRRLQWSYLGLQQTALEQDKRLPLVLADEFPQTHANVLVTSSVLLLQQTSRFLFGQTLLEVLQNVHVCELALGKPRLRHHPEPLAQHAKGLRGVRNDDDGLLDRGSGDVRGSVDEPGRVELARARYAEQRGGGTFVGLGF
jgi:hypothetical protein